MTSRETILQRIRSGLKNAEAAGFAELPEPPVPTIWPSASADAAALTARFLMELKEVLGQPIACDSLADARRKLQQLIESKGWTKVAAMDRSLARLILSETPPDRIAWAEPDWKPLDMAELSVGILTVDALLADTGSCVIDCVTATDRLMCYLPPACVVVARTDQIIEHLPAAWDKIAARCADPAATGEYVFVTGPSRTADIEKILITGVHGPKELFVLLIG